MDNLEYKGYYGSIEYSKSDGLLHGKALGMSKDLILYEGNTISELEDDFRGAIDDYIESCKEMGITPRKAYNGVLNIRIPSGIHCKIARYTESAGTSINAFIRDSIEKRLESLEKNF
ncbi:MAG: type II toxin-antitoxin system HicB family antitoxin [Dysgonamonadaceae bacterium]|jgi:predicted HicB family RNase H-like nuclease|nr:type II toxin-antitoxin system HicB family antitoxin [Dysgonamonadaceae bacterium]